MMRVDAHQHFWRLERGDYRWLTPALGAIHRDFEPRDLAPLLARWRIERTILVQAADSVAETRFLLGLARANEFVAGVVGWIDMEARDAVSELDALASDAKLVGLRPMLQDLDDERWMLRPSLAPIFEALIRRDLAFDALVRPQHLVHLRELVARHPELRVVIDHGAKPRIPRAGATWDGMSAWRDSLLALARESNAVVKLSGFATEAPGNWVVDDLRPFVDALLEAFGPTRVLWGSDWPVVELAGGYDRWREATERLLSALAAHERDAILGDNALRTYRAARSSSPATRAPRPAKERA